MILNARSSLTTKIFTFTLLVFALAFSAHATEQRTEPLNLKLTTTDFPDLFNTTSSNSNSIVLLAQADNAGAGEGDRDMTAAASVPVTEQCLAFAADPDADLGEALRAGCQPSLGQMSALMDNPLGNVAMLFNQFDSYLLRKAAHAELRIAISPNSLQYPLYLD